MSSFVAAAVTTYAVGAAVGATVGASLLTAAVVGTAALGYTQAEEAEDRAAEQHRKSVAAAEKAEAEASARDTARAKAQATSKSASTIYGKKQKQKAMSVSENLLSTSSETGTALGGTGRTGLGFY